MAALPPPALPQDAITPMAREVDPAALAQLVDTAYVDIRARLRK
jgi:hypothetical protein